MSSLTPSTMAISAPMATGLGLAACRTELSAPDESAADRDGLGEEIGTVAVARGALVRDSR